MKENRFAFPRVAASFVALLLLGCSPDHATEVAPQKQAAETVTVQADAHGWVYLGKGQVLAVAAHAPFQIRWLFDVTPCQKPVEYQRQATKTIGRCTIAENAAGSYAFQVNGSADAPVFVRVGACEHCPSVPIEPVRSSLRVKKPIPVASVALGCLDGQAQAIPAALPVEHDEFVSWARSGSMPQWTVTLDDASFCGRPLLSSDKQPFCVVGGNPRPQTTISYTVTLQGCGKPGTGQLLVTK